MADINLRIEIKLDAKFYLECIKMIMLDFFLLEHRN
jgi:hypothetical protein